MADLTPTATSAHPDEREQAVERLKKRRDFGAHLYVYIVINAAI
jgi:hypothetical protein